MSTAKLIHGIVVFQLAWFSCALLQDVRAVLVCITLLVWLYYVEPWSFIRLRITVSLLVAGLLFEIGLLVSGVISYSSASFFPVWLIFLWAIFVSSLTSSFLPLVSKPVFAVTSGMLMGFFSYKAAEYFQVLTFNKPTTEFVLVIGWGALMLLFSVFIRKYFSKGLFCKPVSL